MKSIFGGIKSSHTKRLSAFTIIHLIFACQLTLYILFLLGVHGLFDLIRNSEDDLRAI
jgi:hypothetical protein